MVPKSLPKYVMIARHINLVPTESTQFNSSTNLQLFSPPNVCPFSIKPHLLDKSPVTTSDYPGMLLQSSNGFLLFTLETKRDPLKEKNKHKTQTHPLLLHHYTNDHTTNDTLFITNPITHELVRIPTAPLPPDMELVIGLVSRVDPEKPCVLDKFVIVEYRHIVRENRAFLMCFSSDTAKWVVKPTDYMLGSRMFIPLWGFEYKERFFWVFLHVGLIMWDEDPFIACENTNKAPCRLIPVPPRCVRPEWTVEMLKQRDFGVSGGFIHFLEWDLQQGPGFGQLNLWRLKDMNSKAGEWDLLYSVVTMDLIADCTNGLNLARPKAFFVHPVEADSGYFSTGAHMFSYSLRTRKVDSIAQWCGDGLQMMITHMIPARPTSLPPRFYSVLAKEEGNELFMARKFEEAISCYSKSITLFPNAIAYANRGMLYFRVGQFREAEEDCTHAISLDPNYFKAYARRAIARKELGNLEGSMEDTEYALKVDHENQEMKNLHTELKLLLEKASTLACNHDDGGTASGMVMESK